MANDSVVDERTFREIYTTGFEIAIKEGKSKSIMSSYNEVNGVYANENSHMLQEILVDEWGFDGFVVSDWGGSNDHALGVKTVSYTHLQCKERLSVCCNYLRMHLCCMSFLLFCKDKRAGDNSGERKNLH